MESVRRHDEIGVILRRAEVVIGEVEMEGAEAVLRIVRHAGVGVVEHEVAGVEADQQERVLLWRWSELRRLRAGFGLDALLDA